MLEKAFRNVEDQMGYCGLWCGSCIVGNGTLRELTKRYEHLIKGYGIDEWGAKGFDAEEFRKGLKVIQKIPICRGCLKGGGNDKCNIRPCASKRKVSDCGECGILGRCTYTDELNQVRRGAQTVEMLIKEGKGNGRELKKMWSMEILDRFPYRIVERPRGKND